MRQRTLNSTSFVTGVKLKEIRESKNLSIRQLADISNTDFSFIKKIESGETDPSIITIDKIMKSLDLDLRDFFDERYIELFNLYLIGEERTYGL